jgi:Domain of unknown function (DUF4037)
LELETPLIEGLARFYASLPEVAAVGLGGSRSRGQDDASSDLDLYIFTTSDVAPSTRASILDRKPASRADMGLTYWDSGDEWIDAATGREVDAIFWECGWIRGVIDRALVECAPGIGYSTCHRHTLKHMEILFDRQGWLAELHSRCHSIYPERLRTAIISRNQPLIRSIIPSYYNQIEKAVGRGDRVSVNHRVAALLASYFDILFALNRKTHPGEKRLLAAAKAACALLPRNMERDVHGVLDAAGRADPSLLDRLTSLADALDDLLREDGAPA